MAMGQWGKKLNLNGAKKKFKNLKFPQKTKSLFLLKTQLK